MASKESEEPHRDIRRHSLALRLMRKEVRTRTISRMTSLSRHQLATLRQRWGIDEQLRHRGPAPSTLETFTGTPRALSEGTALALTCLLHDVVPQPGAGVAIAVDSLELGERLCEAYEAYRACFPSSRIEFEEMLALITGLADGHVIGLGRCTACGGALLVDRLGPPVSVCSHCETTEAGATPLAAAEARSAGLGST